MLHEIHLARDFSKFPAGRFRSDGPHSGERFREELLVPALRGNMQVTVSLDGTMGYSSSFLEEAFGGLILKSGFLVKNLHKQLVVFSANDPSLVKEIWSYIE